MLAGAAGNFTWRAARVLFASSGPDLNWIIVFETKCNLLKYRVFLTGPFVAAEGGRCQGPLYEWGARGRSLDSGGRGADQAALAWPIRSIAPRSTDEVSNGRGLPATTVRQGPLSVQPSRFGAPRELAAFGADLPLLRPSTNAEDCP